MGSQAWYRQTRWNTQIETEFFARLARARSQRDQYLVIQALSLAETHPAVALRLIDQYFSTKKSTFDDVRALTVRAQANQVLGNLAQAINVMKEVLAIERDRPSYKTNTFTDYPYLVAIHRLSSEYDSALSTLAERVDDLRFPVSVFKWHAAMSIIHAQRNNSALAKKHARHALDAASATDSGFRFHADLGLVDARFKTVRQELERTCA